MNLFTVHTQTQLPLPYLPPPPPPPPPPPSPPSLSPYQTLLQNKLRPSILLVIIFLAIIFFISALLHLLIRFLLKRATNHNSPTTTSSDLHSVTAMQGQLQQLFHLHDAGVDQAFIDALPIFEYQTIIGANKDPFDCAVCLCEFEPEDRLRLLPKCSHAFHVECIDTWLLTHSTCPLCRRSLLIDSCSYNNSLSGRRGNATATVFILESANESERSEITASDVRVDHGSNNSNLSSLRENNEMLPSPNSSADNHEKVVTVKLGKFKCVENDDAQRELGEGEGTSGANKSNKGDLSGRRRCYSCMGSYEYVMDEQTSLRVTIIKPPKNKKPASSVKKPVNNNKRRLAMSECDCYSRRDGFKGILDSSRFSSAQEATESARSSNIGANTMNMSSIQKKDSFSVSKIWMVPKNDHHHHHQNMIPICDEFKRRAVSFRLPLHRHAAPDGRMSPVKLLGLESRRSVCSEIDDWDLEVGSCNNGDSSSTVATSVVAEETVSAVPSFARRTLHWVIGRQNYKS